MSRPDWIVLVATLAGIVAYGLYRSRTAKTTEGYFLNSRSMPWYLVLLSIMGTQASAITFLSAPGQAFTDGMRFVQYYFGLPLAMVVLCITFVPLFNRLKVFTAYEFLEHRFDLRTRTFTSFLFLLSRGLSTGISIYAPSIILSSLMGWDIFWTNIVMGGFLIIYTVSGGAKAVAYTQQLQLIIIFAGMLAAGYFIVQMLPADFGLHEALEIGGAGGKLNVITTGMTEEGFNWEDRYNIVSGLIGGFFLALSYFGTDQSQVGRYLTAKDNKESKLGLLMNGLVKVPMQFFILLLGVLLFTFYQFHEAPIFFNSVERERLLSSDKREAALQLESRYQAVSEEKKTLLNDWGKGGVEGQTTDKQYLRELHVQAEALRNEYKRLIKSPEVQGDENDTNYIFLRFVVDYLPQGLVGLLIAVIFLAAWGSIAAALNSLASSTMIDFHQRFRKNSINETNPAREEKDYRISKWYTLAWGVFCIAVAQFTGSMGSLIEAVNILGSLFYGVILGIFLVAFYVRRVGGAAVFIAALLGEALVIVLFVLNEYEIIGLGFLWLNVVGALAVVALALLFQAFLTKRTV